MNKTDLEDSLALRTGIDLRRTSASIRVILELMTVTLANNDRIEVRGFGSFSVRTRKGGKTRNPSTGESLTIESRKGVHFKPGIELKERVNATLKL